VFCTTVVYNDTHTSAVLKDSVGLGLGLVFVRLFRFSILRVFFWFSLDYFVLALFALCYV